MPNGSPVNPAGPRALFSPPQILRDERGIAAVEFAMILPIMLVLWIGGVEVTGALSVDRRLNNLASTIGDLTARSKELSYAQVENIFDIAPGALYPEDGTRSSMRITSVSIDDDGEATVAWSRARGEEPAHAAGAAMNALVPETLRVPGSTIIMSEVSYTYRPALGYVVTGDIELDDRMFFVPRLAPEVTLCADLAQPATCAS